MLYLAADNDLEKAIIQNVEEAMYIGSSPGVNVVMLIDRHPGDDVDEGLTSQKLAGAGDWSGARMYFVEKDRLRLLKNFGDANTGSLHTFSQFLQLAAEQFPAERFGLLLSGHGEGWKGVCPDYSTNEEKYELTMLDLRQALVQGLGKRLEFLGFDACLMANFEVAQTLAPLARAVAASEELSPAGGWNYVSMLRTLKNNPQTSGIELARTVGEAFEDYLAKANRTEMQETTYSVIDGDKFPRLDRSVDYLARWLNSYLTHNEEESWKRIAQAAIATRRFGDTDPEEPSMGLIDLAGFSQNIALQFGDPRMQPAIDELNQALAAAVVVNIHGKDRKDASGMSIYLPHRGESNLPQSFAAYATLPRTEKHAWFPLIERISKLSRKPSRHGLTAPIVVEQNRDSQLLTAKVVRKEEFQLAQFALGRQVGDRTLIYGSGDLDPIYWGPVHTKGKLSAHWDGRWFTVRMGQQSVLAPKMIEDSDPDAPDWYLHVVMQLARAGSDDWQTVRLEFYYEDDDDTRGEFNAAYRRKSGRLKEITLRRGDRLRGILLALDAEGRPETIYDEPITVSKPAKLELRQEHVALRDLQIGFLIWDIHGEMHPQMIRPKN